VPAAALTTTHHLLADFFESIPDGLILLDNDWRFAYVNGEAEKVLAQLNATRETLLGRVLWEQFPQIVGTELERVYREAVATGKHVDFENFSAELDSWSEIRAFPSNQGLLIYFRDITARKRAEEALEKSEERWRLALLGSNMGVWQWDRATGRVEWDRSLEALYGLPAGGFGGTFDAFLELVHPEDRDHVRETIAGSLASGPESPQYEVEFRTVHPDGSVHWISDQGRVLYGADGAPRGMTGVCWDSTGRRETEAALRQGEEQLRLALAASDLGHWQWDAKLDTLDFAPRTNDIFGIPQDRRITFTEFLNIVHPDDRDHVAEQVNRSVEQRAPYEIEYRVRKPSGAIRWVSARGSAFYTPDGAPERMIGVVQDITSRKNAEAERDRLLVREQASRTEAEAARQTAEELAAALEAERDKLAEANREMLTVNRELERSASELRREQSRQAEMLRLLHASNRAAARATALLDAGEISQAVADALVADFGAAVVGIWLKEPGGRNYVLKARAGINSSATESLEPAIDTVMSAQKTGWVLRARRPFVGLIDHEDLQFDQQWVAQQELISAAIFPLNGREQLHGVLAIYNRQQIPLGAGEVFSTLVNVLCGSLDNADLLRKAQKTASS
jgi:PAS domain S-box-containing protein